MSVPTFAPARGVEAALEAGKSPDFPTRNKIHYFPKPEPGGKVRLRFLTHLDELVTIKMHSGVAIKPQPDMKQPPKSMSATCRYDRAFSGFYKDCYVCDEKLPSAFQASKVAKATPLIWALACLREEVTTKDGKKGFRDAAREFKVKGDGDELVTKRERAIIHVGMAPNNFWGALMATAGEVEGGLQGQDWILLRQGEGIKTTYVPMAQAPDPLLTPDDVEDRGKGQVGWFNYITAVEEQGIDLFGYLRDNGSDLHLARWFDKRFTVDKDDNIVPTGEHAPSSPEAKAAEQNTRSRIEELRNSIKPAAVPAPEADDPWGNGSEGADLPF